MGAGVVVVTDNGILYCGISHCIFVKRIMHLTGTKVFHTGKSHRVVALMQNCERYSNHIRRIRIVVSRAGESAMQTFVAPGLAP